MGESVANSLTGAGVPVEREGFPDIDAKWMAWVEKETCHLINPEAKVVRPHCNMVPHVGRKGQLKEVLYLDSPGNRPTCETCMRVYFAKNDTQKQAPKGRVISR
jgi:hypothetical protein